ncbi:MAG: hypothetical protein JJ902_04025 [Roseibium sp.]|nr:hypothetical protein [Roseibium sp.]
MTEDTTASEADGFDEDALLTEAKEAYSRAEDAESENREAGLEDLQFARMSDQWPEAIRNERVNANRPCLTINKLPSITRQVVNDSRQNKPSIRVLPVDNDADPETADVINGLIRNIENTSDADVAYDTAIECAVDNGFGYFRVDIDYAFDDAFDLDLGIGRIGNPFSVFGDPDSTAADSSDWNTAFVTTRITKEAYERDYGAHGDNAVDWEDEGWNDDNGRWLNDDGVLIAEYWKREEVTKTLVQMSDGLVFEKSALLTDPDLMHFAEVWARDPILARNSGLPRPVAERETKSHKVTQYILSGAKVLKRNDWPGRYIPIIPVYGTEINVEGKRYFRSLIHDAKDAQRIHNYWRTAATELVALAPRVPWVGEEGTFDADDGWETANTVNHSYLEYTKGKPPPMRQPLDTGVAAGALQEALNASDDLKAITGIFDASLGARSNETSGRAIMARQREGDVSTFHFIDNLSRAIRHAGRVLLDLIPHVYTTQRVIRVIGEDGKDDTKPINQEYQKQDPDTGAPMVDSMGKAVTAMHDLTVGKYDLIVSTGPSFTSRREEAATQMIEFVRSFPQSAPLIGDLLASNLDWPGADEFAKRLEALVPPQAKGGLPPQVQQLIQQGQAAIKSLQEQNAELKRQLADKSFEHARDTQKVGIDQQKANIDAFKGVTDRIEVVGDQQARMGELYASIQPQYPPHYGVPSAQPMPQFGQQPQNQGAQPVRPAQPPFIPQR